MSILRDYLDVLALYLLLLALATLIPLAPSFTVSQEISDKSRVALMLIAIGFPIGYILRIITGSSSEFLGFRATYKKLPEILFYAMYGLIVALVVENIILLPTRTLLSSILPLSQIEIEQTPSLALTFLVGISIAEEIFYNYLIFGGLYSINHNYILSHIASITIFSLSHIFVYGYNTPVLIALCAGRLVLNEVYRRCRMISAPMITHILINLIAFLSV